MPSLPREDRRPSKGGRSVDVGQRPLPGHLRPGVLAPGIALLERSCNPIGEDGGPSDVLRAYPVRALATDGSRTIKLLDLAYNVVDRARKRSVVTQ